MIPMYVSTPNTLHGCVTPVMDSERRYLELSLLYMERRLTYIQLFEDIFNYLTISSNI